MKLQKKNTASNFKKFIKLKMNLKLFKKHIYYGKKDRINLIGRFGLNRYFSVIFVMFSKDFVFNF